MHIHLCDCLSSFTFDMTSLCSWVIQTNCAWWNSGANSGSMSLHFWATFEYHIALINAQFSVNKFVGRFGRLDLVRWTPAKKNKNMCPFEQVLFIFPCMLKKKKQADYYHHLQPHFYYSHKTSYNYYHYENKPLRIQKESCIITFPNTLPLPSNWHRPWQIGGWKINFHLKLADYLQSLCLAK